MLIYTQTGATTKIILSVLTALWQVAQKQHIYVPWATHAGSSGSRCRRGTKWRSARGSSGRQHPAASPNQA